MPEAGDYPSAPVRFSVPLPAVKESENGTILLTAYVKPMAVWKQFFLVLDDVDDLENTGGNETDTTEKEYSIEKTPGLDAGVNGLKDYVNAEDTADGFYKFHIKEADSVKDQAGIAAIAALISAGASSGTAAYYEIGLECETTNETTAITDTGSYVMEIRLPLDESRGNTLSVYRCHDGIAGLMQPLSARKTSGYKDNTYYADWTNGYVYLYTSRFSVYSLYQIQDSSSGENGTVTDPGSDTGSDTAGTTENKNGTYTASVSMRKSDNINSVSMCNPLFYSRADLEVSGNSTKVTLYVINPIPRYAGEGTPLSNIKFIVNGSTYSGSIDTVNKVSRYFSTNEQFIPTAGNYYASPITVTIPTSAVENSADGKVKMSAYVNAVMKSTQEFYVVFGNWKSGETQSSGDAAVIDESTSAASSGTAAAATGISAAETTSGSLASGEYLIPVTAIKEKTSDASMMADYMYPKARLVVDGSTSELTVYILHTVAGVEGGGPEWMSYSGVKAEKETNAVELGGQIYDSFTFTVSGEVPSPMLVTMLINAMKMEVNARLVFDFDSRTTVTGSAEEALEESVEETEKADEVQNEDADMQSAQEDEQSGILSEDAGYQLVTDAWIQGIFILLLTTAATAGIFTLYWHRKRRY